MKTLGIRELREHIDEILRLVEEEGETIEITKDNGVIAHVVPVQKPLKPVKKDLKTFWADVDRLASEIAKYVPDKVDAVEIVRDLRRDF